MESVAVWPNRETTLQKRDGKLFALECWIDPDLPRIVANWYELTVSLDEFMGWFAPGQSEKRLGSKLTCTSNSPVASWKDCQGWPYYIVSGLSGERKAVYTEITEIPAPRRVRSLWERGAWYKVTTKGFVKL